MYDSRPGRALGSPHRPVSWLPRTLPPLELIAIVPGGKVSWEAMKRVYGGFPGLSPGGYHTYYYFATRFSQPGPCIPPVCPSQARVFHPYVPVQARAQSRPCAVQARTQSSVYTTIAKSPRLEKFEPIYTRWLRKQIFFQAIPQRPLAR